MDTVSSLDLPVLRRAEKSCTTSTSDNTAAGETRGTMMEGHSIGDTPDQPLRWRYEGAEE